MVFGSQYQQATASTTATCNHKQAVLREIARPRFPQCRQTLRGRRHLLARALPGMNFSSNLVLSVEIPLPVPAARRVEQREAPIQGLSILGQVGGSELQRRGQQSQGSVNRRDNVKLNRTFMSMMTTLTTNRLTSLCEQAAAPTWPYTDLCLNFGHVLRAFPNVHTWRKALG
jgi:hypothetical protein